MGSLEQDDRKGGAGLIARLLRRPGTAILLLRAGRKFRARGWWRRPPFLPLPPPEYIERRLHTADGVAERRPDPAGDERYLSGHLYVYGPPARTGRGSETVPVERGPPVNSAG